MSHASLPAFRRGAPHPAPSGPRPCRVEHRQGGTTVLARGVVALPARGELVPFVSRLRRDGAGGEVVLVDEATGADLARWGVARPAAAAAPPPAGAAG